MDPRDDTGPHTVESGEIVNRLKNDPSLGLVHLINLIAVQGALPIKVGDQVIGARSPINLK